jgi:hypothetical protein
MHQRAVDVTPIFGGCGDFVFGDEDQIARATPTLEQIFERFANYRLTVRPATFFRSWS